jgi:zinc/manganese transport system substrate-binding protein
MTTLWSLVIAFVLIVVPAAARDAIGIVAAENFYADVAQQIAGSHASVSSIMSNPDQDPHLFEASPGVSRLLSGATIVVYNGADYDPWMPKLLAAAKSPRRQVIVVADLVHRRPGDNPHIWYDPETMPAYATALTAALAEWDPANDKDYRLSLDVFLMSLRKVDARVTELRQQFGGIPVTATEPVFGYMATALGFKMRNERFQLAVMNNAEPRASDVAAFENDLRKQAVRLLLYNSQATDPAAERLKVIAERARIPIVGVSETQPADRRYQDWLLAELDAISDALSGAPP